MYLSDEVRLQAGVVMGWENKDGDRGEAVVLATNEGRDWVLRELAGDGLAMFMLMACEVACARRAGVQRGNRDRRVTSDQQQAEWRRVRRKWSRCYVDVASSVGVSDDDYSDPSGRPLQCRRMHELERELSR